MRQRSLAYSILVTISAAIRTNAILKMAAGANAAIAAPITTPTITGTVQIRNTSGMTMPRARCARYERQAVGRMIASDVPMHNCIRTVSGTSNNWKISNSTGTMTAPPPIPNMPASRPVTTPAPTTATSNQSNSAVEASGILLTLRHTSRCRRWSGSVRPTLRSTGSRAGEAWCGPLAMVSSPGSDSRGATARVATAQVAAVQVEGVQVEARGAQPVEG